MIIELDGKFPANGTGLRKQAENSWLIHNNHAAVVPVDTSDLEGLCCSKQGPRLGKILSFLPTFKMKVVPQATRFLVAFQFCICNCVCMVFQNGPPNPVCFRLTADTLLCVTPALRLGTGYSLLFIMLFSSRFKAENYFFGLYVTGMKMRRGRKMDGRRRAGDAAARTTGVWS